MLQKNMPTEHPLARPHKSLGAIAVTDSDANNNIWHVIDAKGKKVGAIATRVVQLLRGKHRADFTPGRPGDSVVVVNTVHIEFPGHTWDTKVYKNHRKSHSDGNAIITAKHAFFNNPATILNRAVLGMLPKTHLRNVLMRKLYVYGGAIHPHFNVPQVVVPEAPPQLPKFAEKIASIQRVAKSRSQAVAEAQIPQ